ncbi:hypothetical protein PsorP6_002504 [Peronosclerospora sorghi]|uniref:Uncharacterized protein n=1 Tax=Peronosclerospora sorghi TaxID=230839 RepID=A0ACC0WWD9_9STRA|nr:hypothetical protein PsorP6_002504 [Peronosclerospora sorghi]
MNTINDKILPLGAELTDDGKVIIPASRRADGSMRKPIRIRQDYVPQDEVPKYKTVAQRRREQAATASDSFCLDEIPIGKLSLAQETEASVANERPSVDKTSLQEKSRCNLQLTKNKTAVNATDTKVSPAEDHQRQLKKELMKINKRLNEIAKLEDTEKVSLSKQQKQEIRQKTHLQQQRNNIIAELNGATIKRSSDKAIGSCPKVAISM